MEHDELRTNHLKYLNLSFNVKTDKIRAAIRRDFGVYHKRRNMFSKALSNLTESLGYNAKNVNSQLQHIQCNLEMGNINQAHYNSSKLVKTHPDRIDARYAFEHCEYETNEFERTLVECRNVENDFQPKSNLPLLGPSVVTKTINQSIGLESGQCLLNMRNDIERYAAHVEACRSKHPILWKSRRENKECDVVSVIESGEIYKGPVDKKRIAQKRTIMNSLYMGPDTAKDIDFLQKLKLDPRLNLPQLSVSSAKVHELIDSSQAKLGAWRTQLQHRKPLYVKQFCTKAFLKAARSRRQNQTRREIFQQLVYIRKNIESNFETTLQYIEQIMGKYYSIKTLQIFPRKAEFATDIFNLVGKTFLARECIVPSDLMTLPVMERLSDLLQVPDEKKDSEICNRTYGDRSLFIDPDAPDMIIVPYIKRLRTLELQLNHSVFPEERCYLCYQIAQLHIAHRRLSEAVEYSRRLLLEAHGNDIWTMLGHLSAIRSEVVSIQYIKAGKMIQDMMNSMALSKCMDNKVLHFCKVTQIVHSNLLKEGCMAEVLMMETSRRSKALSYNQSLRSGNFGVFIFFVQVVFEIIFFH